MANRHKNHKKLFNALTGLKSEWFGWLTNMRLWKVFKKKVYFNWGPKCTMRKFFFRDLNSKPKMDLTLIITNQSLDKSDTNHTLTNQKFLTSNLF